MPRKKKTEETPASEEAVVYVPPVLELPRMMSEGVHKYLMVNLIAKRAADIKRGHRALVELRGPHDALDLAIAEAREGLLHIVESHKEQQMVNLIEN